MLDSGIRVAAIAPPYRRPLPARPRRGASGSFDTMLMRLGRLLDARCVAAVELLEDDSIQRLGAVGCEEELSVIELDIAAVRAAFHDGPGGQRPLAAASVQVVRCLLPSTSRDVVALRVTVPNGGTLLIVAMREPGHAEFTINEERAARRTGEWIADFVELWWRGRHDRQRGDSLHAALDLVGVGVFVLDHAGRLADANEAARVLLDAGDGLRLVGDMLTASSLDDAVRLQTAIAHARADSRQEDGVQQAPVLSIGRKGARPLYVAVMRAADCGEGGRHPVVIHAVDPEADVEQPLLPTCAMYGFTGAETRLTRMLVSGSSLAEAAARLRIQAPTARTYLKQVFAKTGTNRQAALVQLLLTSMVRTGPQVELTALK